MTFNGFESSTSLWMLLLAQLLGISIAWITRLSEGTGQQKFCQILFFTALPTMAILTILTTAIGPGWWLICSTTLTVMILTVTYDFCSSQKVVTW